MSTVDWRLNYWVLFVAILPFIHLLLCYKHMKCETQSIPCDVSGTILLLAFVVLFVLLFSTPPMWGWGSPEVISFIVLTPVSLTLFLIVQFIVKNPLFPPRFFKNMMINAALFNVLSVGALVFGTVVVSTLWFESPVYPHGGIFKAGAFLVPYFAALAVTSSLFADFKKYFSYPLLFSCGAVLALGGELSFLGLNATSGYADIWWRFVIIGAGVGLLWGGGAPFCNSIVNRDDENAMAGLTWIIFGVGSILGATLAPLWYVTSFKHQAVTLLSQLQLSKPQVQAVIAATRDSQHALLHVLSTLPQSYHQTVIDSMRSAAAKGYQGACWLSAIFSGLVLVVMLLFVFIRKQD